MAPGVMKEDALHGQRRELAAGALAVEAGAAIAAAWVLVKNSYPTAVYKVITFGKAPPVHWFSLVVVAAALTCGAAAVYRTRRSDFARACARAWAPLLVNLLIVARAVSGMAPFYVEGLVLALSLAAALYLSFPSLPPPADKGSGPQPWLAATIAAAIVGGLWFYTVQERFLSEREYGWRDAGLYYARVANTARGEGFLQETPALPPFYDHFGPGLAALVPAWWLWGSYHLVMAAQAAALALLAPAVYIYARGRGARGPTAFLLGAAALLHPSVSQMAYSFSYGFHPITLAMPLVILSIHLWEKRRWWLFVLAAAGAVSMEETVLPLYAGLGAVSFLWDLRGGWAARRRWPGAALAAASLVLFLAITKIVMPTVAGREYFQMAKYAHLGEGFLEVLASPVIEARAFWGLLFAGRSLVFTALLVGSAAFLPLLAPRQFLYAAVVFVFVLLLENEDVKSISFWYQALLVAAWLPAAAAGALAAVRERRMGAAAAMALCAVMASHFYGLTPFSRVTMPFQATAPESVRTATGRLMRLAKTTPRDARVVATMREAMLFADSRVTPVSEWGASAEADMAVLDPRSTWGQTPGETRAVFERLWATGMYEIEPVEGVLVLRRRSLR